MRVSVAMCTYNGARYIREQLDSILHQSRQVDEVVISDDGSTDETIAILQQYAAKHSCVHYSVNKEKKGFMKNFIDTMYRCTGDVIFLADQDDVWVSDKAAVITEYFANHPNVNVLFTNGNLINENGDSIGETMFDRAGFDEEKQNYFRHGCALDILTLCNRSTGATMAIKRAFIQKWDLNDFEGFREHDFILTILGLRDSAVDFLNDRLINYRIHSSQTISLTAFDELFQPVEEPRLIRNSWETILTKDQQQHCEFIRIRYMFRYSWFGLRVCGYAPKYVSVYGAWWYKFFIYDYRTSWKRSLYRIRQKMKF